MINLDQPIIDQIPSSAEIRGKMTDTLRELEFLRRLLSMAELAEKYREYSAIAEKKGWSTRKPCPSK